MSARKERRKDPVAVEGGPSRRMGDRRDSPRIPLTLWVRMVDAGGSFEEKEGDVGVGGAHFKDRHHPVGKAVQLRFRLPEADHEFNVDGEILRVSEQGDGFGAHVRFVDPSTEVELAIARYLDRLSAENKI
jgi:hypothetical protein